MNVYGSLRQYMNQRALLELDEFQQWERWFKARYLEDCIFYQAKEQSHGDNTAFAQLQLELASNSAFQEKAWNHFLQLVDKTYKEYQKPQVLGKPI